MIQPSKVLVIEDDGVTLRTVVRILQEAGFQVRPAGTALQGVRVAREERPDLILMDVGLPDVDGAHLASAIREIPALRDVPVILMSAREELGDLREESGAADAILKPFSQRKLLERVRRWSRDLATAE